MTNWVVRSETNQNGSSLTHYGILGMKWGVRRTPEQLGHVKKGTKIYRVTPNPNEDEKGSTYVTYLAPDRDMYRGMFAKSGGFQQYYNLTDKDPLYEAVYKNKEDLKVATYDITKEVTLNVLKQDNDKLFKNLCVHAAEKNIERYNETIEKAKELRKTNPNIPGDDFYQKYYLQNCKTGEEYMKKVVQDFMAMTPDDLYQVTSSRFGVENTIKESVISELKKKGYNAMVDQASVGGTRREIEGQAPMIIFNRDEVLEKVGVKKISKLTMELANQRYWEWNDMVNSNPKKVDEWAYEKRTNQVRHSESTLIHYGIKGMKWGIRRTPEQLGHRHKRSVEGSQKFKYRSSPPDKRQIVNNAATAIGGLAMLTSYAVPAPQVWAVTLPTIIASAAISSAVNNSYTKLMADDSEYIDPEKRPLNSLPKKTREMTREEDCAAVNVPLTKGCVNNCSNCILAYDMRRRGYDVSAAKTNAPSYTGKLVDEFYKGKKDIFQSRLSGEELKAATKSDSKIFELSDAQIKKKVAEKAYNKMVKEAEDHYPIGSRGYINITYPKQNVGHVFNWERDETGMNFYDAQSGKNQKVVMYTFSNAVPSYTLTRLDNLTPNSKITTKLNDGEAKKK